MARPVPTVRNYAHKAENIEIAWIPLADGRRLAARLNS